MGLFIHGIMYACELALTQNKELFTDNGARGCHKKGKQGHETRPWLVIIYMHIPYARVSQLETKLEYYVPINLILM